MILLSTLCLSLFSCASSAAEPRTPSQAPAGFWDVWGDGKAELSGYQLTQPRYGTPRRGEAVLVFVTEQFTAGSRVKSDGGHGDEFPVIKLNEARDFQTGVYDYNIMTSAFVRLDGKDALGIPTKVAFSGQEWCGHVYDHLITHGDRYDRTSHSYFDGEADQSLAMDIPAGGVFLDAMPLYVRGVAGELVPKGGSVPLTVHPRLMDLRFLHRPAGWMSGTLSRSNALSTTTVPAGEFKTETFELTLDSSTWTWEVEAEGARRLIRWTGPDGEVGAMTGSIRSPYWNKSGNADESLRKSLGLGEPSWLRSTP